MAKIPILVKIFLCQDYFHLWLKRISLFLFMLPQISDSLNSSKASSQLGFTLEFSQLHVCMLNLLVLISYKKKKNTHNEYMLEKTYKLLYLHVSVGINRKYCTFKLLSIIKVISLHYSLILWYKCKFSEISLFYFTIVIL